MIHLPLVSLTDTTAQIFIAVIAVVTTLVALLGKPRWYPLIGSALTGVIVWLVLEKLWHPFPDKVPAVVYVAGSAAVFVLVCAIVQRRWLVGILAIIALVNAGAVANVIYQQYPTLRSLNPIPVTVEMTYDQFRNQQAAPTVNDREVGALVTVPMHTPGFAARDAMAYVPPAYWSKPDRELPVLVLLAGNPGKPAQWFGAGEASQTADDYQSTHDGLSPIVISVDATGSLTGNPGCVDGPKDKVDTYLSSEVPQMVKEKFRVVADQSRWTIGGLSYGGTCALQIVTNHPESYGSFLDFSGQAEPSLGTRQQTIDTLFGGDEAAFDAVNPATLLANNRYPTTQGRFVAGEDDPSAEEALQHLNDLAQKAGMTTTYETVPGGHSYQVWRVALVETFEWAAQRGGL